MAGYIWRENNVIVAMCGSDLLTIFAGQHVGKRHKIAIWVI